MAESREEAKIIHHKDLILLAEDIFRHPQSAFDSFVSQEEWSGKDLVLLHILFSFSAPFFVFLQNLLLAIYDFVFLKEPISIPSLFWGTGKVWLFYLGFLMILRFLDVFRLYHRFWDRTQKYDPEPPWIFLISFLPFSGSGLFWILPAPFHLFFVGLAFFYCLHLSYQALATIYDYTPRDFLVLFLRFGIFCLFLSFFFLLSYNLYRWFLS